MGNKNINYDIVVIGGGATGLGVALEAITRGYKVLLLEGYDFGKGTSSKSTKLIHGGIRYLANFDFALVREGLEERYYFLQNIPHLAYKQRYIIPLHNLTERVKYTIGTKLYDALSGGFSIGKSHYLNTENVLSVMPNLDSSQISGGIGYYDGLFDDTRVLMALLQTFLEHGGVALNYHQVTKIDKLTNETYDIMGDNVLEHKTFTIKCKHVFNAAGTFSDAVSDIADQRHKHNAISVAQGTHLVFERNVFDSNDALLIPETPDGRVLFIRPWYDKIIVGTTDIKKMHPTLEPIAEHDEIMFILNTLNQYIDKKVTVTDIKSIFCGQRPLVKSSGKSTAKISRKHVITQTETGVINVVGGKWTIYRRMGQDAIDFMEQNCQHPTTKSITKDLHLSGYTLENLSYPLSAYGINSEKIKAIQLETNNYSKIHHDLPYYQAEIIYHVRHELAKTVEDILLRRTRAMFLNANAAMDAAKITAEIMAKELNLSNDWISSQLEDIKKIAQLFTYKYNK